MLRKEYNVDDDIIGGTNMNEIKLTIEEKNMLDKLTHANKMDCWFWIDDERDCIVDLENDGLVMDTASAVIQIWEGTPDVTDFLTQEEADLFEDLVDRCF